MTAIRTFGLDHVDLTVNDLARSVDFYDMILSALGFRRLHEEKDHVWASAHLSIAIRSAHDAEREAAFNRHRVGLHHLAFRAHSRDDIDRFHEFLISRAVVVLDPPREYPEYGAGYYALFFADPDAIKLEIVHHPWGYWKRVLMEGSDERPRHTSEVSRSMRSSPLHRASHGGARSRVRHSRAARSEELLERRR